MSEQINCEEIKLKIFKIPDSDIVRYEITNTMGGKVRLTADFQNALNKISLLHMEAIEQMNKREENMSAFWIQR